MENERSSKSKEKDEEKEGLVDGIMLVSEEMYEEQLQSFLVVKQELLGEKGSANFCREYERLFYVLAKTKENEQRMISRCSELNQEVLENHVKLEKTIEMCLNNKQTIEELHTELEAAKMQVRNAQENETEASHLTKNVKLQFTELSDLLSDGSSNAMEAKKKEDVSKMLQMKTMELEQATLDLESLKAQVAEWEAMQDDENNKAKQLENLLATEATEMQREQRKKEKLERDLRQAKDVTEEMSAEAVVLKSSLESLRSDLSKQQQQYKEQKMQFEKFVKENNLQQEAYRKLQNEATSQETNYTRLANDFQFKNNELKLKEEEIAFLRQEFTKMKWAQGKMTQKLKGADDSKNVLNKQFETLKADASVVEKELSECRTEMETAKKELNEYIVSKEANKNQANMTKVESRIKQKNAADDTSFIKLKFEAMKTELKFYMLENSKLRNSVRSLQRVKVEKLKCQEKLDILVKRVKEQALSFNLTYADIERKNHDMKVQLKELNSKMEMIRVERNSIAKNALEIKSEAYNMKQQMTLVSHQVDQLREQTSYKDAVLLKERHENQQLTKNIENYKDQFMKLRERTRKGENSLSLIERENGKLLSEVEKSRQDRNVTNRAKKKVMTENNVISSQLIRRNDEMALLYEKIKLLEDNLNRGLIVYNRRLEDIRILKMEVRKLRCTNLYMLKGLETMEEKRREIFRIQQENLLVRTRCKVLEDELENPLNIHRWRKLKGSDPSEYEMILKLQWLQKRLISKTQLVVQKEKTITEKELLFGEIKKTMARQAGPETLQELSYTRSCLNKANNRVKALQAEMKMYKSIADTCREKGSKESAGLKEKYLKLKRQKDGVEECVTQFTQRSQSTLLEGADVK